MHTAMGLRWNLGQSSLAMSQSCKHTIARKVPLQLIPATHNDLQGLIVLSVEWQANAIAEVSASAFKTDRYKDE